MAETWGIPPWTLEEEAPAIWVERWHLFEGAKADRADRQKKPKPQQKDGTQRRRLI